MKTLLLLLALTALFTVVAGGNPEADMNTVQIIEYWGYPVERYNVTTKDGYVLEIHRIPHGKVGPANISCRPVVFMQHGLQADSNTWAVNPPNESAAFIFADAGYDVWLGNMRGTVFGRAHTSLSSNDRKFWDFSWSDMADSDLPAMIDKALAISGQHSVYYIGNSQGTLTMFAKLSTDVTFNKKIKKYFATAPVGSVKHSKGALRFLADYLLPTAALYSNVFGPGIFLPNSDILTLALCPFALGLCSNYDMQVYGPEVRSFNNSRSDVYLAHSNSNTSTKNMEHWTQMVKAATTTAKRGIRNTMARSTATYLYWVNNDYLATEEDIRETLLPTIKPEYLKGFIKIEDYNHGDFVVGTDAAERLYFPMIKEIQADGADACVQATG